MTLILIWLHEGEVSVIADTRFTSQRNPPLEIGPKIFSVPITLHTNVGEAPQRVSPMGFAFAGDTPIGQVTHAIATAGLQALFSPEKLSAPSVEQVASYYARIATGIVEEFCLIGFTNPSFEAVIFGHDDGKGVAYSLEIGIDLNGAVLALQEPYDFKKHLLYAIGQGAEHVQAHIDAEWAGGRKSTVYEALGAVIRNEYVPSVGGSIQCAITGPNGVELKAVLQAGNDGLAKGGYMGLDIAKMGLVGAFVPFGSGPVVLKSQTN